MRFLLISEFGDTGALAQRILAEDHECSVWITDKKYEEVLQGIVPRVNSPAAAVAYNPDIVLVGETGLIAKANIFRSRNFKVIGGEKIHDDLENKRFEVIKWAASLEVPVPETVSFKTTGEAKSFLKSEKKRYITKYDDDDTYTTYLGKSNDDVAAFLDSTKPEKGFILQEYIEPLLETSIEIWFSQGKPIMPPNGTIEQKRFLAGDLGPNSGSESSIVWSYKSLHDKFVKMLFTPLFLEAMKKMKYTGPLDMAVIVGKDNKPRFIEATPRLGIDAIFALLEIMESKLSDLLNAMATGREFEMKLKPGFGFVLSVSIPPYPYEIDDFGVKNQRVEIERKDLKHIWFDEVHYKPKQGIMAVGLSGLLLSIGTSNKDPIKAVEEAKEIAGRINTSEKQFRVDAGEQVKGIENLRELGYL